MATNLLAIMRLKTRGGCGSTIDHIGRSTFGD